MLLPVHDDGTSITAPTQHCQFTTIAGDTTPTNHHQPRPHVQRALLLRQGLQHQKDMHWLPSARVCAFATAHMLPPAPPPMPAPKQSTVTTHSFPSKAQGSDPLPALLVPPPQHISTITAYSFSPISPLSLHNGCRCHHSHSYSLSPISPSTWLVQAATRPSVSSSWLSWSRARPQKVPLVNSACADGREGGGGGRRVEHKSR